MYPSKPYQGLAPFCLNSNCSLLLLIAASNVRQTVEPEEPHWKTVQLQIALINSHGWFDSLPGSDCANVVSVMATAPGDLRPPFQSDSAAEPFNADTAVFSGASFADPNRVPIVRRAQLK